MTRRNDSRFRRYERRLPEPKSGEPRFLDFEFLNDSDRARLEDIAARCSAESWQPGEPVDLSMLNFEERFFLEECLLEARRRMGYPELDVRKGTA